MSELPYPLNDPTTGKVICQLCGKPFLVISPTHLKKHGISTYEDYTTRFPGAQLSTDEFKKRGSVGRKLKGVSKDLFTEHMNPILNVEEVHVEDLEPEIEEIDIEQVFQQVTSNDPMKLIKLKVLDQLKINFPNVRENYLINLENPITGDIYKSYITDFADPVMKIDFEFPNSFWHNKDSYPDFLRDENLKNCGWLIVKIDSSTPSIRDIEESIQKYKKDRRDV